ncbi:Crp/Fnr family transcriptional regulator [Motiliproteus sediminis]|uniref:Crp/Fnr family transcriptional regulator n=1 Tax=Motiliproteus sediminis TaxID=1468178 RepID=UPI001AF01280|nr:Crp/Fnr family transcriptional regulator [Motiliproteus sediminis]
MDPRLLNGFPALASINDPAALAILAQAQAVEVPAGQVIFRPGDPCQNYLMVVNGRVKVTGRSPSGREIVLYRIEGCGTCVLTTACLLSRERYPAEGVSETPVLAFALPQPLFQQALAISAELRDFIFGAYGQRLSAMISLVQEVAFERIDLRLARYLVSQSETRVEVRATHQELATELGSAREVVSRQLKEFERRGWIQLGRGTIRVDAIDELRRFADAFQP